MKKFGQFTLDNEKDIIVELFWEGEELRYVLRTPNHGTGNLITNLARVCALPISRDIQGLKVIEGSVPCYVDGSNRTVYVFRMGDTKVANIYPDGTIERKASVPAIAKTLMSQTKDYRLDIRKTLIKTYIRRECKFRTDLHTHMNANLAPDVLIALGIVHNIRYPLYYIKKLGLSCTEEQRRTLEARRRETAKAFADSPLTGKYLERKINDNTFLSFADLIAGNPGDSAANIAKIRASLAVLKDGQAVFTNLEKVYLYRYVFTKGTPSEDPFDLEAEDGARIEAIGDGDVVRMVRQMLKDRKNPAYRNNTIFQDKLLWIARGCQEQGVVYKEISDTTLVKQPQAAAMLQEVHAVMPAVTQETGVTLRFLAAIRRTPLTIVKDNVAMDDYFRENLRVLRAVAGDPYVAGSDIIGEEINDIRELEPVIREIVHIAAAHPSFVVRIHAGENDSLRDNVASSIACVKNALAEGQKMPWLRIGHGLYTANLRTKKGRALIRELRECGAVLEFQITSNVRLNNLTSLAHHPLRQYLAGGVGCVQGTDGGALYGTDSIDEQLALERLLGLSLEELCQMRRCEDRILEQSLAAFDEKMRAWDALGVRDVRAHYEARMTEQGQDWLPSAWRSKLPAKQALADCLGELPQDGMPVVVMGGSFNSDRHRAAAAPYGKKLIDGILEAADPDQVFFVVGHRLRSYERYLVEQNRARGSRFRVYAIVPAMITPQEAGRLRASGAVIRVSIEPAAMGLYKSFAYEIFKRRRSMLLAFDGSCAGANMIQEAKNAKYECRTYVNARSRLLGAKAASLQGYVTLFREEEEALAPVLRDLEAEGRRAALSAP